MAVSLPNGMTYLASVWRMWRVPALGCSGIVALSLPCCITNFVGVRCMWRCPYQLYVPLSRCEVDVALSLPRCSKYQSVALTKMMETF